MYTLKFYIQRNQIIWFNGEKKRDLKKLISQASERVIPFDTLNEMFCFHGIKIRK